jgi:hypothetical protein
MDFMSFRTPVEFPGARALSAIRLVKVGPIDADPFSDHRS